jgi:hypothetical protein
MAGQTEAFTASIYDRSAGVPRLVATLPFTGHVVPSPGGLMALATVTGDTSILDVSDPAAPRVTASYHGSASAWVGDQVLAAEGRAGLAIHDGARAGGPIVRARLDIPLGNGRTYFYAAAVGPSRVYATGNTERGGILVAWDTSADPPALVFARAQGAPSFALAKVGTHLVVGAGSALEVLDPSSPGGPVLLTTLPVPTSCLTADGNLVYVGTLASDLLILDLADPGAPVELGRVLLPGLPYTAQAAGLGLLLVAADRAGLVLVDVSNPTAPFVRSSLDIGSAAFGVALDGSTAWIAAAAGLATADVSKPDRPALLAQVDLPGEPFNPQYDPQTGFSVGIHQGIAYVGTVGAMVEGFDVRFPASPRLVSLQALSPWSNSYVGALAFDGTSQYVAGHFDDLLALLRVDVTQPRNLVVLPTPSVGLFR